MDAGKDVLAPAQTTYLNKVSLYFHYFYCCRYLLCLFHQILLASPELCFEVSVRVFDL